MPDPIIDDPGTALDGNWYDSMAGEDQGRIDALSKFDTADDFYKAHDALNNADWRDGIAGEDDKFKATLNRFDSPGAFGTAYREAQQTISAGVKPATLAADANEDDVKAFREANGIPLEAGGYLDDLPDGLILGDDDRPAMEDFVTKLHSMNADPRIAHGAIEWYNDFAEKQQDAQAEVDTAQSKEATDALRETWGGDYRTNINGVEQFLTNTFGKEVKEQLVNGRFQDGRAFMNDPKILEGLAAVQRVIDPLSHRIPNEGDPVQTMNDEIAEIEKFMREKRTLYNKDEKMQARLRDLYDIRTKHQAA